MPRWRENSNWCNRLQFPIEMMPYNCSIAAQQDTFFSLHCSYTFASTLLRQYSWSSYRYYFIVKHMTRTTMSFSYLTCFEIIIRIIMLFPHERTKHSLWINKTCYFGQILSARQNLREFFWLTTYLVIIDWNVTSELMSFSRTVARKWQ